MICIDLRVPKWVGSAVALAVPCLALAAPAPDEAARRELELVQRITIEQATNGPHSAPLAALFAELGAFYEEASLNGPALVAFEEARGVIRANHGLSSLEEAPMLESLIRVHERMGDVEQPWQLDRELLALARAHPKDLRTVAIYHTLGDKRIDMLERYLAGEFSPQLVLGCYYHRAEARTVEFAEREPNCAAGSRGALIDAVARETLSYYASAVKVLTQHRLYSSRELHELESKIIVISLRQGIYGMGRQSLRRLLAYDAANQERSPARAESQLQLADWDMITAVATHDRRPWNSALDGYRDAYHVLVSQRAPRSSIDALFSPDVPVVLPTFVPSRLVTERTAAAAGYVDVAFDITKYGHGEHVEILYTTDNVAREAKRALISTITRSVFRPRVLDGRIADATRVVVRYYIDD